MQIPISGLKNETTIIFPQFLLSHQNPNPPNQNTPPNYTLLNLEYRLEFSLIKTRHGLDLNLHILTP